jgi:putative membrane protein
MYRFAMIAAAIGLTATSAVAQMGNPGFWGADTKMEKPGVPAPHQTNNTDRLFAQLAAAGGMAEVQFAKMTLQKSKAKSVKDFADIMAKDHGAASDKLRDLADAAKIPLPEDVTPDHTEVKKRLDGLEGAAYDVAYIKAQIVDHQKTAQLLAWEIGSGEDAQLQRFAADTLPKVLSHLQAAQAIHAELTGAAIR